jgi:PAS domain S-box-containing protein
MTLMKRPVQVSTVVSTVRAALRDRRRQYAVREHLAEEKRQAELLRAADARWRLVVESVEDYAIITLDLAGRVQTWNPGAERVFGWAEAEIVGRDGAVLFTPEDRAAGVPAREQATALATGRAEDERWHIRKDGTRFFASGVMTPLRDGHLMGYTKVCRDVTARRQAEQRERFLVTLADRTRAAADAEGVMWATATTLAEHFRVERCAYTEVDDAAGTATVRRDFHARVPSLAGTYPLDSFGPGIIADLRAGRTVVVTDTGDDARTRDATAAYAAIGSRAYVTVPLVKGGRLVATLNVISARPRDWTAADAALVKEAAERAWQAVEAARAQTRLAESEARLQLAVEIAQMGTFDIDLTTDAVTVNEPGRAIYGWASPHTTFAAVQGHFHPDDRERVMASVGAALDPAGAGTFDVEQRIVRTDGETRWIRVRGRGLFAGAGDARRATRLVGTYLDVTDRKRAETELREADRKKDDFLALLAHELRNPLAPVRNGLQVIRLSSERGPRERAQAMMDRQLTHMVRLIDDLLDVSRISRNKMELRRARISLADAVGSAVETARPAIEAAGHDLRVDVPAEPVLLDADLTRVAQVIANLLTNSAKYTERGGRIELTARRDGDDAVVSVTDTGIGIPAESLGNIFDLFSQVDRSIERATGGLGIGLALVKGLVEMHGGTVTAASAGPGKGSTFTVRLPAVPARDAAAAGPAVGGGGPSGGPGRRILVVDDNRDSAESMGEMLQLFGNEVALAHDGVEAVERAGAFRPQVILMDVGMPRLNGYEATRRIREQPWGKGVAIVALTGWGQEGDRSKSRAAGCDGHLVKPVSLADLQRVLAEVGQRGVS